MNEKQGYIILTDRGIIMLKVSKSIFDKGYEVNPTSYFKYLRENDPVHYEDSINAYFISNYKDVKYALKNNEVFTTKTLAKRAEPVMKDRVLAQMSGHEHKAKKKAILKGMTGKYLEKLIPILEKELIILLTNLLIKRNRYSKRLWKSICNSKFYGFIGLKH